MRSAVHMIINECKHWGTMEYYGVLWRLVGLWGVILGFIVTRLEGNVADEYVYDIRSANRLFRMLCVENRANWKLED